MDDPARHQISSSCLDFLITEVLRYTAEAVAYGGRRGEEEEGAEEPQPYAGGLTLEQEMQLDTRIEALGYEVGYRLTERTAQNRVLTGEPLDAVKFICKDLWIEAFRKQVDKLQTDHRGTFVLKDSSFRWTTRYTGDSSNATKELIGRLLQFPRGLLKGSLANLGHTVVIRADYIDDKTDELTLPEVTFNIKMLR
ncbi:unnamed protein product [Chrysoparadoxa australica]